MKFYSFALALIVSCGSACSQTPLAIQTRPGPTFTVADADLHKHVSFIAYGDMRFTDPSNTTATNPDARKLLVNRIAELHPDAVQMSGDVPWHGGSAADYEEYRQETRPWTTAHLRVYPALGNHEFSQCAEADCLDHWWKAFPELKGMRWYSTALGKRIYFINLDSLSPLTDGSPQRTWLADQFAHLPKSVDYVMLGLHHPPVADVQTRTGMDHNPRPNEIALRDYLSSIAPKTHAAIVVTAGHVHNYERFNLDGVTYLVSGGGGAQPVEVDRTPPDQYQRKDFPNYHYIVFTLEKDELKATMVRLADPEAKLAEWDVRDEFVVKKK